MIRLGVAIVIIFSTSNIVPTFFGTHRLYGVRSSMVLVVPPNAPSYIAFGSILSNLASELIIPF
jgi:hypothetical protein